MLRDDEKREIEREAARYPHRRAVCIEALKIVQHHRGWISDEAIDDVAAHLDMSPAELDGVATFYNLIFRKPVGKRVVFVCTSITCWVMGCDRLLEQIQGRLGAGLGEATSDGRFTVLPIQCLGACDRAPALMVGEDLHLDLDPERADQIDTILRSYGG